MVVAVLVATPQGRAVVTHVLRFAGIELQQEPGPVPSPRSSAALPGERRVPLAEARRHVSFPILVPAVLGRPSEVVVSDGGRVASLIYRRTPHGLVRMDEFAGHLDPVFFQKFIHLGDVTQVRVNGLKGLWITGPHVLLYITRDGTPAAASARLTTGNTLIWGTRRVALRLEGDLSRRPRSPSPARRADAAQARASRTVSAGTCHRGRGVAGVRRNRKEPPCCAG